MSGQVVSGRRRWVVAAVVVLIVVAAVVLAVVAVVRGAPGGSSTGTPSGCTEEDPCLDQPGVGADQSDQPTTEPSTTGPAADPSTPPDDVELLVTSSGWDPARGVLWVAADVPVVESDATCTLTATRGADQVGESVAAEPGPRTTTCAVEIDGTRLSGGDWLVTLSYLSGHHSGTSQDVTINVP